MLPPDFEYMSLEERREFLRHSPGMIIAREVGDMVDGVTKPLTAEDIETAVPLISQAAQAITPIPGFIWKRIFKWCALHLHPGIFTIAAILAAIPLPIWLYLNGRALADFLISHGLFDLLDWIRAFFSYG
ncbi:hypothetical protein CP336_11550 [Pseudomonas fluorescens]|nr:hypothetical protein CP336_11550 [Pseudomonas fluorescens]